MTDRLTEATALLKLYRDPRNAPYEKLDADTDEFLSRAPAPAAAPCGRWWCNPEQRCVECAPAQAAEPCMNCLEDPPLSKADTESILAELRTRTPAPAAAPAPEPSVDTELAEAWAERDRRVITRLRASLAAVASVRDRLLLLAVQFRLSPQVHSTYRECADRITKALGPGGGTGEKRYRATCRICAAPLNRDTGASIEHSDCPACGEGGCK